MNLTNISKKLSFLLRHSKDPLYIDLNGGWADVDTIIDVLKQRFSETNLQILEEIVAADEKGRYSFNESHDKIRANQGHSIPGVIIEMEQPSPPELLYHGTAERFHSSIMDEGLKPGTRQFVHISSDYETAVKVGSRHGKPVVLIINAKKFTDDGNELYISPNGVWQARYVPPKYFTVSYPQ